MASGFMMFGFMEVMLVMFAGGGQPLPLPVFFNYVV